MSGAQPFALVQPITRILAELQASIVSEGIRAFDGWLERFVIYTLIARLSGLTDPAASTPISVHALAASLGQPYETVRRHVNMLAADGLCTREANRVRAIQPEMARPHIDRLVRATHDSFVRFVEHFAQSGEPLPPRRNIRYDPAVSVQAAADIMLAAADTNREVHSGWLDLVLFSTIVAGNCREHPNGSAPSPASRPVGGLAVARTIGIGPATVSRHLTRMQRSGQLRRVREGYLISPDWLSAPHTRAVTQLTLQNVRRLLGGIAARGFPFDDPASAYLDDRPPLTPIG